MLNVALGIAGTLFVLSFGLWLWWRRMWRR